MRLRAQGGASTVPGFRFSILSACTVHETGSESEHFHIPVTLCGVRRRKEVIAIVDSGASTLFIHRRFVHENKIRTRKLREPIRVYNIDGTENKAGAITEVAVVNMQVGDHTTKEIFTVTDIGLEDVMIGIDCLRYHNPKIDWFEGEL